MSSPRQFQSHLPTADGRFTLLTLGTARLAEADQATGAPGADRLPPGKGLALVVYLHCSPGRTATREHLTDRFWNDCSPEAARQTLRQTIYRIRAALGAEAITSVGESVTLNLDLTCDRDLFLAAIHGGRASEAVGLYGGQFFPAYAAPGAAGFEQWADLERDQLQAAFLRAAESAVRQALDRPNPRDALRLASKARDLCPASEPAWRLLLESLLAAGNRPGASLEADALLGQLHASDREPEPATARLLARLRQPEVPSPAGSAPGGPDRLNPELVGREREFALLLEAWPASQTRPGRHVHLSAPAGLGKTRLLEELARRLRISRGRIVQVRGTPGERHRDCAFLGDLVHALGQLPGVTGVSPDALAELTTLAPSLSSFLPAAPATRRTPGSVPYRTLALAELVESVAQEAPLVLLLDDLHWVDDTSWAIIDGLVDRLAPARVLVVTAAREETRGVPAGSATVRVNLEPLTLPAVEALLTSLGSDPNHPAVPRLAAVLHQASGGSPLLGLELLQLAIQRGRLEIGAEGWRWDDPEAMIADLAEVDPLRHRIGTLREDPRTALRWLAVAQVPLPGRALSAMGIGWEAAVDQLEQAGLITRTGELLLPAHDEIAAAALRLATPDQLTAAHAALASWTSGRIGQDPGAYQRAARHWRHAGQPDALVRLFKAQARRARQRKEPITLQALARQALGPDAGPSEVTRLTHEMRAVERWTYHTSRTAVAAALAALSLLPLAMVLARRPAGLPEATLLAAIGDVQAGERMELYQIPIFPARWPVGVPLTLAEGKRIGVLPEGYSYYTTIVPAPDGGRILFDRVFPDSGGIDLVLREPDGRIRRLTEAPGDDFGPAWAPDGSAIVFGTARWTPHGDEDSDIAILDLATGEIRQLTAGPDSDGHPAWSPDGTRAAFTRLDASSGLRTICWVTVDGSWEQCTPPSYPSYRDPRELSWTDSRRLRFQSSGDSDGALLSEWAVDSTSITTVVTTGLQSARVQPGGSWMAGVSLLGGGRLVVGRVGEPGSWRPWEETITVGGYRFGWDQPAASHGVIESVRIAPASGPAILGISHFLTAVGLNGEGDTVAVHSGIQAWEVSDISIAVISKQSGVLHPLRAGRVTVRVSAGGWRRDSLVLEVVPAGWATVFREEWTDPTLEAWQRYGDPVPAIVSGPGGLPALINNGDGQFESGVLSRLRIAGGAGLGLETVIATPISQPKWQSLRVKFLRSGPILQSGILTLASCGFDIPGGEGAAAMGLARATSNQLGHEFRADSVLRTGSWYRLRIQLFPDGTCGVALDGIPIFRGRAVLDPQHFWNFSLYGQTVGTRMLVGPLQVWTGVRTDVDWSILDRGR